MREFLRDIVLSFCPAWIRSRYRPQSPETVIRSAMLTGILQALLCAWGVLVGYKSFLIVRTEQYGATLNRGNETTQAWFGGVFFVEYILFHPLALLLLYLALEGCIRFVGALCVSEVIPSLPVSVVFAISSRILSGRRDSEMERLRTIPDAVHVLEDGCIRVASALSKPAWNASVTIEIQEKHYEVEREERGAAPRSHIYWLRPAPIGKILRGYERYDVSRRNVADDSKSVSK